ncbi:MAG TPA: alpha/beta hydrolase [Candidatus Limnocylindrales bacterium]|jgi:proline iminopeptidase
MTTMIVRDTSLYVDVVGRGDPVLLMHGGPGLDHVSLTAFRDLADRHTVVLYDHRCNGRSTGAPVTSMTFENLTADADALREALAFDRWAVLGHSFGGHVALEYALRYPERVSRLILLDTAGDARWSQENAADVLAGRGFSPKTVAIARRFYSGRIAPKDFVRAAMRLLPAYDHRFSLVRLGRDMLEGGWRMKTRPEALVFGGQMMRGWSVMDRLGEIRVPTLVIAGRDDFLFPPESQALLAAGIPYARLRIIERAGHNPQSERAAETLAAVGEFLAAAPRSAQLDDAVAMCAGRAMPELDRRVSPSSHRKRWAPVRSRSWGGSRRHLREPFSVQDTGGDTSLEGVVQPILVSH